MIAKEFKSITEAYLWSLKKLQMTKRFSIDHLIVTLTNPLANWQSNISTFSADQELGSVMPIAPYEKFHSEYEKLNKGGVFNKKSGKDWIVDRIEILCPLGNEIGSLKKSIREFDEKREHRFLENYDYLNRLIRYPELGESPSSLCMRKKGSATSNSQTLNQLAVLIYKLAKDATYSWVYGVVSVYNPCIETLGLVPDRRNGNIGQIPCLTTLNFTLTDGHLNLFATWRHQTFDHKAYGNWFSLLVLLKLIVDVTNEFRMDNSFMRKHRRADIKAGNVTSVACRADFVKTESRQSVYSIAKPHMQRLPL